MQPDALYVEFGRLVREHRLRLKLTQIELARKIGLTRTSVTNIEKGRQKVLLHQVFLIADALGVSAESLVPPAVSSGVAAEIEAKLEGHFTGVDEREWARRIVVSGSKGGAPHATSTN